MRIILKALFLTVVAVLLYSCAWPIVGRVTTQLKLFRGVGPALGEYLMGIGYVIDREHWTEFSVPPGSHYLRTILNGSVRGDAQLEPGTLLRFALEYELLDSSKQTLTTGSYHFAARQTLYADLSGSTYTANRYEEDNLQAWDRRKALLHLGSDNNVAYVRFRLVSEAPALQDVVLRLYAPKRVTPGREMVSWSRMNHSQRQKLASASTMDYRFLSHAEVVALVRQRWQPMGPAGIKDQDYWLRRIFSLEENEGEDFELSQKIYTDQLVLNKGRRLTVPLPEQPGRLKVVFAPLGDGPHKGMLHLVVHGLSTLVPQLHEFEFSPDLQTFEIDITEGGGLLEVSGEICLTASFYYDENEISPEPMVIPTWLVGPNQAVTYSLDGSSNEHIPFRLNTYFLAAEATQWEAPMPTSAIVFYRALDEAGNLLLQGEFPLELLAGEYDFYKATDLVSQLSEVTNSYFQLPVLTRSFEISASVPLLVNGAIHPSALARKLNVPEDYWRYREDDSRLPAWFLLNPMHTQSMLAERRAITLRGQVRPPQPNPLLLSGDYAVNEFQPEGRHKGTYLMVPRKLDISFLPQSAASAYVPIPANEDTLLTFLPTPSGIASPNLLFIKQAKRDNLRYALDDADFRQLITSAPFGELSLGPLQTGQHRVRLENPPEVSMYVSGTMPEAEYLRKMFAFQFENELVFSLTKPDEAAITISGRWFSSLGNQERTVIQLEIVPERENRNVGPTSGYSFLKREFAISASSVAATLALDVSKTSLDEGMPFYVALNEDLPAGSYRLVVRRKSGPSGYLRLGLLINDDLPLRIWQTVPALNFEER